MKNFILTVSIILLLNGCSQVDGANPSQNSALNNLAGKKEKTKDGFLQNSLNSWLKSDWKTSIEKDETIKEKYKDSDRSFTLQEYIEKANTYDKVQDFNKTDSHVEKINSMPVIGSKQ